MAGEAGARQPDEVPPSAEEETIRPGRTAAFSDGVFAIAATLLVLDIRVPAGGDLLGAILHAWPAYASYAVSFLTIGIIWMNHHTIFEQLRRVDRPLLVINLFLLMVVALIPFPTALLAAQLQAGHDEAVAGATYGITMAAMGALFGVLWAYVLRRDDLRTTAIDAVRKRTLLARFGIGAPVYAAGIGMAFVNARISLALYAALALYYLLEQVPLRSPGGGSGPSSTDGPPPLRR